MLQVLASRFLPYAAIASVNALSIGVAQIAHAQTNINITVTTTSQQSFDGFGVTIGGQFLPAGGRKGRGGSVSAQVYDRLFKSNDANSVKLSFLRLEVNTSNYKTSASAGYDFDTAVEKSGEGDMIRAARSRNPGLKIMLTPWTPPYWMKYNNAEYNAGAGSSDPNVKTTNRLKPDQYNNYATLLKTFCDNFKTKFGFYPHAISLQNEVDMDVPYGSCVFTDDQYKGLLTAARKAFPWGYPTKLWGPELGGNKDSNYIGTIAGAGLLDAIAQHSYNGDTGLIPDWAKNNLKVNQTEYSAIPQEVFKNDQPWIAATSINQFCKDANKGKVSSWFHWNAVGAKLNDDPAKPLDVGESLIVANTAYNPNSVYKYVDQSNVKTCKLNDNTLYPADGAEYSSQYFREFTTFQLTSLYYAFRRLTQSVTPGSVSRQTTVTPSIDQGSGLQNDVYAAGFKRGDGKYCLVVANSSKSATYNGTLKFDELGSAGVKSFNTYYTSGDGSVPVNDVSSTTAFNNGEATTILQPHAVYIFVQK